ncbi:hypothetical protein L6R52_38145, partial [Myxococcota bacterium]|nr:hypothetical protein [Myxococcota bacterium]
MLRPSRSLALAAALGLALASCVATKGASKFRAGQRAHDAGDLEAAKVAYDDALKADPANAEYKTALAKVEVELAERHATEAKAKEKAGDWKGASEAWARAAAANPSDADLKARKGLSALKAANLGPDDWYEGVKKVSDELPGNAIASKALAGARARACQYHIELGDKLVESNDGRRALEHYDRAQQIDAAAPGLDKGRYKRATALARMQEADDALAAGDAVTAVDLYTKAFETDPLPEIKVKLAKARTKSSAVTGKLDTARALVAKGKNVEALKVYETLSGAKGVPASVAAEVEKVRAAAAKDEADRSVAASKAGDLKRAQSSLTEALKYATLTPAEVEAVKASVSETTADRPGRGLRTLEDAGLDANKEPVAGAARALAVATAKKSYDKAKAISKKDSAAALALLSDLGPFEDDLPAIKDLRKELRSGSFNEMLDEALRSAKAGNDEEAGMLLAAALSASNAPESLRDPAGAGADALKGGRYADAEAMFTKALAAEPRSKLAQRGLEIARLRKKESDVKALDVVKSGKGDVAKAVDVLVRALAAEPGNAAARQAADVLVARAEAGSKTMSDAELGAVLRDAARVSEAAASAKTSAEEGAGAIAKGDHASAESAFTKALEAAPSLKVAKLGQSIAKQRTLLGLKSGAKKAAEGDEAGAKTLAELLKKDPNDAEAKAALQAILDKAKAAADKGNDAEAAKQLALATIAIAPLPGVKVALDQGNTALGAS